MSENIYTMKEENYKGHYVSNWTTNAPNLSDMPIGTKGLFIKCTKEEYYFSGSPRQILSVKLSQFLYVLQEIV